MTLASSAMTSLSMGFLLTEYSILLMIAGPSPQLTSLNLRPGFFGSGEGIWILTFGFEVRILCLLSSLMCVIEKNKAAAAITTDKMELATIHPLASADCSTT